MNESSYSGLKTDNSICSKETINTSTSFERDNPLSDETKRKIIKSISKNLREIIKENIQNNQMQFVEKDIFYFLYIPEISIDDYINRIYKYTKMNISTLIMSIIYIDRLCEINNYILSMNNIHKIILASSLVSIKFNEDTIIRTKYYSEIAGIPVYDLNNLEFYFCLKLKFSFFVDYDIYQKYFEYFFNNINETIIHEKGKKDTNANKKKEQK